MRHKSRVFPAGNFALVRDEPGIQKHVLFPFIDRVRVRRWAKRMDMKGHAVRVCQRYLLDPKTGHLDLVNRFLNAGDGVWIEEKMKLRRTVRSKGWLSASRDQGASRGHITVTAALPPELLSVEAPFEAWIVKFSVSGRHEWLIPYQEDPWKNSDAVIEARHLWLLTRRVLRPLQPLPSLDLECLQVVSSRTSWQQSSTTSSPAPLLLASPTQLSTQEGSS